MRSYVRHPSEFPVELRSSTEEDIHREQLQDVSIGGLSCRSKDAFEPGETVTLRIPVVTPGFEAEGRVVWCRPCDDGFRLGIEFVSETEAFKARMVEQVCQIGRYHKQLLAEGRDATEEEAGLEWISKYAARFPGAR